MALFVRESGPAAAPTVIFLHGGGVGGWMWQEQVRAMPEYHCLVPDLPEHGHSLDAGPYTMAGATEAVAELIRTRAHGRRAHCVGLSLGAQLIVVLLASHPELVDRAVISGALVRPFPGVRLLGGALDWSIRMYLPIKDWPWLVRLNMRSNGIPSKYFEETQEDTRRITVAGFGRLMRENLQYRLPDGLQNLSVPALVVVGQKEYGIMRQSARDLTHAIPSSRGYVVDGVGHNWALESPDRFTALVRAWLADQPLPGGLTPLN